MTQRAHLSNSSAIANHLCVVHFTSARCALYTVHSSLSLSLSLSLCSLWLLEVTKRHPSFSICAGCIRRGGPAASLPTSLPRQSDRGPAAAARREEEREREKEGASVATNCRTLAASTSWCSPRWSEAWSAKGLFWWFAWQWWFVQGAVYNRFWNDLLMLILLTIYNRYLDACLMFPLPSTFNLNCTCTKITSTKLIIS